MKILILILIIEINLSKAQISTYHGIEIQFYLNIIKKRMLQRQFRKRLEWTLC